MVVAWCSFPNANVCTDHTGCMFILRHDAKIRSEKCLKTSCFKKCIQTNILYIQLFAGLPNIKISYSSALYDVDTVAPHRSFSLSHTISLTPLHTQTAKPSDYVLNMPMVKYTQGGNSTDLMRRTVMQLSFSDLAFLPLWLLVVFLILGFFCCKHGIRLSPARETRAKFKHVALTEECPHLAECFLLLAKLRKRKTKQVGALINDDKSWMNYRL